MTKRVSKWLAAGLAACMLTMTLPTASMEEADYAIASDWVEAPEADMEFELELSEDGWIDEAEEAEIETGAVQTGPYLYASVTIAEALVFADEALTEILYNLSEGDPVLVVRESGEAAEVSFATDSGIVSGYVTAEAVSAMTAEEADVLQNTLATGGSVALYQNDLNWPLPRVFGGVMSKASDFTALSNDQEYVVQGVTITARMVGDHSDCWSWARALYNIIWGVKFTSDWEGTDETGRNFIRNLTDDERQLTGANLKKFISASELGCTLRICSCPRNCSNIDKDGCSKHEKHSLIVVARDSAGMVVMDNMTGNGRDKFATRYYTWDKFASHWAKYKMIKYIKWPYAPAYGSPVSTPATVAPTPTPLPAPVAPTAVSLDQTGTVNLGLGCTLQLNAGFSPAGAVSSLTWKSSNEKIATVSSRGLVTPVKTGTATVGVVTANGLTATVKVNVVTPSRLTLSKSGTVSMTAGQTLTLQTAVSPAGACPDVNWTTSNARVATVTDGVVTAVGAGTATITAKTVVGGKSDKVKVKVTDP